MRDRLERDDRQEWRYTGDETGKMRQEGKLTEARQVEKQIEEIKGERRDVEREVHPYTPAPLHSGRVVSIKSVRQLSQNRVERVGRVVLFM